jgi:hypothetical protein
MAEQLESEPGYSATSGGFVSRLSTYVAQGLRYWEPRRLVYNGVLALVVIGHFVSGLPGSWDKLSFDLALGVFILAVLANIAYCAAYVADLFVQFSGLDSAWRRGRVILLAVGTAFAATFTHFIAQGIFNP